MKLKTISICLFFIIIGWNCNAKTFSTAEHPKSKGIELNIEYPDYWIFASGKRPNTLATFTSDYNNETTDYSNAVCVLTIKKFTDAEELLERTPTKSDWEEIIIYIKDNTAIEFFESTYQNAKVLSSKMTYFDKQPGFIAEGTGLAVRSGQEMYAHGNIYFFGYENKVIAISCSAYAFTQETADKRFEIEKQNFAFVANSIIVMNQYK